MENYIAPTYLGLHWSKHSEKTINQSRRYIMEMLSSQMVHTM